MKPRKTCQLRITNTSHALWHLGSFHQRTAPLSFPLKNYPHKPILSLINGFCGNNKGRLLMRYHMA